MASGRCCWPSSVDRLVPVVADNTVLAGLLARELQALESFVVLLQREQELLAGAATELLTALSSEKSGAARELGRLSAARDVELGRLGLPEGRPGMDAWVADGGRGNRRDWDRLIELAGRARAFNEVNGGLITSQLRHNQHALNILMAAVDQTTIYGPDGQQKPGAGRRSLGSA